MSDYQIIVSHPAQQHSYHLAAGVKKQGMLIRHGASKNGFWEVADKA